MGNGAKRHKTGYRTHLYATTGATRCSALMPGILVDTLLRIASCGSEKLVYRSNLSRRIAEMADPSTFKPILPPLPATFSQSFSGVQGYGAVRFAAQNRWYRSVLPVLRFAQPKFCFAKIAHPKLFPAFSFTAVVFRSADSCSEERSQLFPPNPSMSTGTQNTFFLEIS